MPKITLKISITDGYRVRDYVVHDDKRPGALKRMQESAIRQASESGDFSPGATLNIVSNWTR